MALETNSLSNGNLYLEDKSLLGKVEEMNLPSLKFTQSEHKALGLIGVPSYVSGLEKMEGSIKWNSFYSDVAKVFTNPYKAIRLMFRSSVENWQGGDLTDEKALVTHLVIQVTEWPNGSFKKGDPVEMQTSFTCTYIKQVYDGEVVFEVDVNNNIFFVNGEDVRAKYRENLGI